MDKNLKTLKAIWIRGFYDWLSQYNEPIHILINNKISNIEFLRRYENEMGLVTLNIAPASIINFKLTDEFMSFNAQFSGSDKFLNIPLKAINGVTFPKEKNGLMKPFSLPGDEYFDFQNQNIGIDSVKKLKIVPNKPESKVIDFASRVKKKDEK